MKASSVGLLIITLLIIFVSNWCSYYIGSKDGYKRGCIHRTVLELVPVPDKPTLNMQAYGDSYTGVPSFDNAHTQCVAVPGTKDEYDCEPVK